MQKVFIYKTAFSNGRPNFLDLICADDVADAENRATVICEGISDEYSCDPDAEVEILGEAATDAASIAEMIADAEA